MKVSASQLRSWEKCSLQAKYRYVDKIDRWTTGSSAHFGTSVHAALEALHNGATVDEAIDKFRETWQSTEIDYWNRRTSESRFKDLGPKMIKEYFESYKWTHHITLGTEFRFMVPFGEHLISGIVDHFYTNLKHDHLYIVDFKTAVKPNLDTLHLDIQFSSYDWASRQREFWVGTESDDPNWPDKYSGLENGEELFEKFKDVPRSLIWYDLRDNRPIDVGPRTDFDYARMYRLVEQIARAVEYEVYVPNISAESCLWCDYTDLCPVYFDPQPVEIERKENRKKKK